jgi:hypothetical protein
MTKIYKKEQALSWRQQGRSIATIATELDVSKSTVSVWCRDIALSEKAIANIAKVGNEKATTALMKYSEEKRARRQLAELESAKKGADRLHALSDRDIYCIGLGLYWGEGYKTGSQEFGFTNSDPRMVMFYMRWLKIAFCIERSNVILRISINQTHKHRVKEVEAYWSKLLSIPLSQFTKTSLIKSSSKKVYKNTQVHMGTLRIKVRKGTNLRREILGAIAHIT